jgi:uncharacterized protein YecE (DUF72 family)
MAGTPGKELDFKAADVRGRGEILVGTAGWTLPRESADAFPADGTHLERYGRVLAAVEINSTFHRPHRKSTYERWAASVPDAFRFCLKAPKTITHEARLAASEALVDAFLEETAPLGARLACLLFQLPPSFAFDEALARGFFEHLRRRYDRSIACEPRHASWFEPHADAMLAALRIARVAADPATVPAAAAPGGYAALRYFRWHGAPRMYYSGYPAERIAALAAGVEAERDAGRTVWCMFDNTVTGAAMANALDLRRLLLRA